MSLLLHFWCCWLELKIFWLYKGIIQVSEWNELNKLLVIVIHIPRAVQNIEWGAHVSSYYLELCLSFWAINTNRTDSTRESRSQLVYFSIIHILRIGRIPHRFISNFFLVSLFLSFHTFIYSKTLPNIKYIYIFYFLCV